MTTTDAPTTDDFERLADAIDATTTLALAAADALDRSTSSACDHDAELAGLSGEVDLGEKYRRLRSEAGFDKLKRVLQVYQAWINRLLAGNMHLEGAALMSADDLRMEINGGLSTKRVDALERQVRACREQLAENARAIERHWYSVGVVRDLLADGT